MININTVVNKIINSRKAGSWTGWQRLSSDKWRLCDCVWGVDVEWRRREINSVRGKWKERLLKALSFSFFFFFSCFRSSSSSSAPYLASLSVRLWKLYNTFESLCKWKRNCKMSNIAAEINMFMDWQKNFWSQLISFIFRTVSRTPLFTLQHKGVASLSDKCILSILYMAAMSNIVIWCNHLLGKQSTKTEISVSHNVTLMCCGCCGCCGDHLSNSLWGAMTTEE